MVKTRYKTYISSNKYFRSGYGEKLRQFLGRNAAIRQLIDFGDAPVFTAIAYPSIISLTKTTPNSQQIYALTWQPGPPIEDFAQVFAKNSFLLPQKELTSEGWRLEGQAIYNYLLQFKDRLTPGAPGGRKPGTYQWYEIQDNIAYWQEFERPKILYPDIYEHKNFTIDMEDFYFGNTCYFIPTDELWLCGLLNSQTVEWFYSQISSKVRGGYMGAFSDYMKQIPIPKPPSPNPLEPLVTQILAAKKANPNADTSALEGEITLAKGGPVRW